MQVAQMYVNGREQDYCRFQQFDFIHAMETVELVKPTMDLRVEFLTMAKEYLCFGDSRYVEAIDNFKEYMTKLENFAAARNLPEGFVPSDTFWLLQNNSRLLGCSRLRHSLTPHLEHEGGHIGYDIRPLKRHKGYGTRILAMTLDRARQAGLNRVLLVCAKDNLASVAVIQKNGGRFENEVFSKHDGKLLERYWIEL